MKTAVSSKGQEGLVEWLLACPEKGFFVPIESESIDTHSAVATALANKLTVATRNRADFAKAGVDIVDPFIGR